MNLTLRSSQHNFKIVSTNSLKLNKIMRNPKLTSIIYNSISIVGNGLNECLSPIYLFLNILFETSVETHLFTKAGCQHTGTDACSANFNKAGYILLICFESAQGWLHKVPHAVGSVA